jgi:diketogulonate reductase-like aldo/keto reductase
MLVQRDTQCSKTPILKPSSKSKSNLPFAWITAPKTDTIERIGQNLEIKQFHLSNQKKARFHT